MTGTLIFVVGPSGVGKDTLLDGARGLLSGDSRFHFLRRDITREASAGGEDHNAVSQDEFARRLGRDEYALHWGAHSLRYGLPYTELKPLTDGESVIANGSRSVLDEARRSFAKIAIVSINADETLLRERLRARGREIESDIEKRIMRANAFEVSGDDVFALSNNGRIEEGIAYFVELLAKLDGRLFGTRRTSEVPTPRRGVYLISRDKNRVLFAFTKSYNLPGGGIESGEAPTEALKRELLEETGYRLIGSPTHICDASASCRSDDGQQWHKINRYYAGDVDKVAEPTEPDHTAVWADPTDIWEELPPELQYALKEAGLQVPEMTRA